MRGGRKASPGEPADAVAVTGAGGRGTAGRGGGVMAEEAAVESKITGGREGGVDECGAGAVMDGDITVRTGAAAASGGGAVAGAMDAGAVVVGTVETVRAANSGGVASSGALAGAGGIIGGAATAGGGVVWACVTH